ncbi:MAG: hypothetical protein ACE5IW_08350 [bacterium]
MKSFINDQQARFGKSSRSKIFLSVDESRKRGPSLHNQASENRFERLKVEIEPQWLEHEEGCKIKTEYFVDHSREILAKNDSPDV